MKKEKLEVNVLLSQAAENGYSTDLSSVFVPV